LKDPKLPDFCSCETFAHGDLGLIEPEEPLARVVCDPRHISRKDRSIKPGVFPPSHIAEKGLSLMRPRHLSDAELKMHADAIASHDEKDIAVGVIEGEARAIRALVEADGNRSVCLFDDPVKDDPDIPDNPAHALLVAARQMPAEDIAEIRTRLLTEVFGSLNRFPT
jgi:hypothetical protein